MYNFTYEVTDGVDNNATITFNVTVIDNPCVPNITSMFHDQLDISLIIGENIDLPLDHISNGNCTYEITLAERKCNDPIHISAADLAYPHPLIRFTQQPFEVIPNDMNDDRIVT